MPFLNKHGRILVMFTFQPSDFEPFHQLLISLALGLLVGLQREWAESPLAGIRSFALTSLLGTISAILSKHFGFWTIALGFSGTLGMMLVGQFSLMRNPEVTKHRGLVSELSILMVFYIGVLVHTGPVLLAASIAGILAFVLQVKLELHTLATRFDKNEIRSIMQFVLVLLVIFPVVPNKSFGPYDAINPHNIWLMVVLIVGISLLGYILYKFFGRKAGVLLSGLLGGVVSSTATTITCSKDAKKHEASTSYFALTILMAWSTLYPRVYFELMVTTKGTMSMIIPLAVMMASSLLPVFWLWSKSSQHEGVELHNQPTGLHAALTFALMYAVVLLATSYFKEEFGNMGLTFVALVSGVVDVDAITLSSGRLISVGALGKAEGENLIIIAILSNNFFKGLMTLLIGGRPLFSLLFVPWLISLLVGTMFLLS